MKNGEAMETVEISGREVEVSRFTSQQVHDEWDRLEKLCGEIDGTHWKFGRPSEFLDYARRCGLVSLDTARELYFVSMGLKIAL